MNRSNDRKSDHILDESRVSEYKRHLMPAYQKRGGLRLKSAKGVYLEDVNGRKYIDFTSGMFANILGYGNEEIAEAVYEQAKSLTTVAPLHQTDLRLRFCSKLLEIAPRNLNRVSFSVGGGPAIESAMKIALKNIPDAKYFISLVGGYHGTTFGSMSATFLSSKSQEAGAANPHSFALFSHGLGNCFRAPRPYYYRSGFKGSESEYAKHCANQLRDVIVNQVPGKVVGVIMEPLQSAGGQLEFPKEYLHLVRKICDEMGILLIFDEIQTYCRTDRFFAAQYYGVNPDILVFAKGMGAGVPIAGILIDEKLKGFEDLMEDMQTFQNNHLGFAAALKAIEIIKRDDLLQNVRCISGYFYQRLTRMQEKFPQIGEIRGPGLAIGVEMVCDRETKKELGQEQMDRIFQTAMEKGVFLQLAHNVIKVKPPINMTLEEAALSMDILESTFEEVL